MARADDPGGDRGLGRAPPRPSRHRPLPAVRRHRRGSSLVARSHLVDHIPLRNRPRRQLGGARPGRLRLGPQRLAAEGRGPEPRSQAARRLSPRAARQCRRCWCVLSRHREVAIIGTEKEMDRAAAHREEPRRGSGSWRSRNGGTARSLRRSGASEIPREALMTDPTQGFKTVLVEIPHVADDADRERTLVQRVREGPRVEVLI
jgi:hypothetical protein